MSTSMDMLNKLYEQYQPKHLKVDDDTKHKLLTAVLSTHITALFSLLYQFSITKDFDLLKKELRRLPEFFGSNLKNEFMKQITEEINAEMDSEDKKDPDYLEFLSTFQKDYSEAIDEISKPLGVSLSLAIKKTDEKYPQAEGV